MKVRKDQIFTSPSDLNNFVSCKYHAFNDLNEHKDGLKKRSSRRYEALDQVW